MRSKGMDFLALPAAFTVSTGIVHWRSLVLARAIENLCYVVTAAQTGSHPGGRRTYGHSMIVDPWGDIMKDSGESTKIISAPVDFDRLAELRRKFPVLAHRRLNEAPTDNALMDLPQVRGIGKQESSDID
jgi:nitrilase